MKFATVSVFIGICLLYSINVADGDIQKRSTGRESCPKPTDELCKAYINEEIQSAKLNGVCKGADFSEGTNDRWIDWKRCGSIGCPNDVPTVPGDMTKDYPHCCPGCQ